MFVATVATELQPVGAELTLEVVFATTRSSTSLTFTGLGSGGVKAPLLVRVTVPPVAIQRGDAITLKLALVAGVSDPSVAVSV